MRRFKNLETWKVSMELAVDLYKITAKLPKSEVNGWVNQIRQAGISIPSKIAEGTYRQSNKEYIECLYTAFGGLKELETQLIVASDLNYIEEASFTKLKAKVDSVGRLLVGLIKYLESK